MASDWVKARKQFEMEIMKSAKGVNKSAQQILVNSTASFLDFVQDNKDRLPYYTANLHDSIATSVSISGRIIRANYMPKEATKAQTSKGRRRIIGANEAVRAIMKFRPNKAGVYATLFVAVPYATGANISSQKRGYYEWLQNEFISDMTASLRFLEKYPNAKAVSIPKRRFE